jgi:hypothetical protein
MQHVEMAVKLPGDRKGRGKGGRLAVRIVGGNQNRFEHPTSCADLHKMVRTRYCRLRHRKKACAHVSEEGIAPFVADPAI